MRFHFEILGSTGTLTLVNKIELKTRAIIVLKIIFLGLVFSLFIKMCIGIGVKLKHNLFCS